MDGVEALQQWLPVGWLTVVDSAGVASTEGARQAVAHAVTTTLMALTTRVLWTTLRGFVRLLAGGGRYATPKGALSGLRWIAGMAFFVAPWVRVYEILQGHGDDPTWTSVSMIAATVWGALLAADHRVAAIRGTVPTLVLARGFAIFQRSRWQIPLGEALIDADTGGPIGSVRGGRRRVRLRDDVQQALDATLGATEGRDWLRTWLARHDLLLLAGTSRSAGASSATS